MNFASAIANFTFDTETTVEHDRFMKNAVPLTVLLFLTSALGFEQAVVTTAQEDKHVEEEIRRLNAEEVNAFLHKDPQAMAQRWPGYGPTILLSQTR